MNDKLAKEYILKLLEYEKVKFQYNNLGYTMDRLKIKFEIIDYCIQYIKNVQRGDLK